MCTFALTACQVILKSSRVKPVQQPKAMAPMAHRSDVYPCFHVYQVQFNSLEQLLVKRYGCCYKHLVTWHDWHRGSAWWISQAAHPATVGFCLASGPRHDAACAAAAVAAAALVHANTQPWHPIDTQSHRCQGKIA